LKPLTSEVSIAANETPDFDALSSAVSDAIDALVAWDITALQSAVERQSAICNRLGANKLRWNPADAEAARKIRDLNRIYDRLLQHSVHWTRTIRSILEAGGYSFQNRTSVHFRG